MSTYSLIRCSALIACFLSVPIIAFAADTIAGTVRNQTTGQPVVGDEVILLRLDGMQEEARTKTDTQGAFALNATDAKVLHVVRVLHHGVNYDQSVTGTHPLEVRVFDSVTKIPGLSGNMGIAQMETAGKTLKVTEVYAITNASAPPVTQSGASNFEISLPTKAALDTLDVRTENTDWIKVAPAPVRGQKGRYNVDFPLRPGVTIYRFTYHLPYEGPTTFHLKLAYPIKNFAVSVPPSMSLNASRPGTFKAPGSANGVLIYAANGPVTKDVPAFVVAGAGDASSPPIQSNAVPPAPVPSSPPVAAGNPHPAPAAPDLPNDQPKREFWLLLSAIAIVLAAGAFSIWKMTRKVASARGKTTSRGPLLDALKEELFQLENNRLHGSISAEEYNAAKAALNENIQRAMARSPKT